MDAAPPEHSLTGDDTTDVDGETASGSWSTITALGSGDVIAVASDGAQIELPDWVTADLQAEEPRQAVGNQPSLILLMIEDDVIAPVDFIHALTNSDDARAVVVCGRSGAQEWRAEALVAGATGCISPDTPAEDRKTVFLTAVNYSVERQRGRKVRKQSEQLCFELASVIGSTSEELLAAKDTARQVHTTLEDLRHRIVRIFV